MGQQWIDTGWVGMLITILVSVFVLFNIYRAHGAGDLYIRRIPGLNAIDEAVGRATEMGRPVMMVPGVTNDVSVNAKSMQAIKIFAYISRVAARFATPILVCCSNAGIYTVATEIIREVYREEGVADRFDPDAVRFISDRQFAFAAGVSGLILREESAACFFMGEFYAESLILAETANSTGAIQVASSTELTQTPFFIAACDYVLIGDEFYAASAFLTRQPVLVGSLIGQDWCKFMIAVLIVLGVIGNSFQMRGQAATEEFSEGKVQPVAKPRLFKKSDTFFSHLLNPDPAKDQTFDRPQGPPEPTPAAGGG